MFSVLLPLFWAGHSPKSIHQAGDHGRSLPQEAGGDYLSISGRLVDCPQEQAHFDSSQRSIVTDSTRPGVHCEPSKVRPHSSTKVCVPGCSVQPQNRLCRPLINQDWQNSRDHHQTLKETGLPSTGPAGNSGHLGILYKPPSLDQITHETAPTIPLESVETIQQECQLLDSSESTPASTLELVAGRYEPGSDSPVCAKTSSVDVSHRCKQSGLGRIPGRRPVSPGHLAGSRSTPAYKHSGDESSVSLPTTVLDRCSGTDGIGEVRQYVSSDLCKQTRGNKISPALHADLGVASVVQSQQHRTQGGSYMRGEQQAGGFVVQEEGSSYGMVSRQRSSGSVVQHDRDSVRRPVCLSREHSTESVLHVDPKPAGMGNGRPINFLGRHDRLRLPTSCSGTQSIAQDSGRTLSSSANCPDVAKKNMVHTPPAHASSPSDQTTRPSGSADSTERQNRTPRARNISTDSLAIVQRRLRSRGFSKVAARLISNAVRGSTRTVYKGRFNEFVRWCNKREVDPFSAPISDVANFLAKKFKAGLSHSTVCGYRSAISSYHEEVNGQRIGESKDLTRLLKGIFNTRPPTRSLPPRWSLEKVLSALNKPPYEPLDKVPIKYLTMKTTFLLAIVSAARGSDISKLGYKEPYLRFQNNPPGIRLVPRKFRKQDRPGHYLQEMFITKFESNRKLDPVRAVRLYLRRVENRRGELESLFITFGAGQVKSPSSQTIARWIRSVIQDAPGALKGPKARAHSTRSLSTSLAFQKGIAVTDIMKAADWSSDVTFASFYLKEVTGRAGVFGRAVLDSGAGDH